MVDETNVAQPLRKLISGPGAAIIAALVGGIFSLISAILPSILPSSGEKPMVAAIGQVAANAVAPPVASEPAPHQTHPHLTYGSWTLIKSIDDAGTNWHNSVLKFTSQRETVDGLELEGVFEWRGDGVLVGREYVLGHYVPSTRIIYLEGQRVESSTGRLAVGSFSAHLSEDNRRLTDGTWGSTFGNQDGVPGSWEARR
jgi:hypothetical protein